MALKSVESRLLEAYKEDGTGLEIGLISAEGIFFFTVDSRGSARLETKITMQ